MCRRARRKCIKRTKRAKTASRHYALRRFRKSPAAFTNGCTIRRNGKKGRTYLSRLKNFRLIIVQFAISATRLAAGLVVVTIAAKFTIAKTRRSVFNEVCKIIRWYFWRKATIKIVSSDHRRESFFDACVNASNQMRCGIFSLDLLRGATCIYRSVKNRSLLFYGRMLTYFLFVFVEK